MSFLADVGRAGPVQAIQSFQGNEQAINMNNKTMAVQDLKMKKINQELEIAERQKKKEIEEERYMATPRSFEGYASMFEDGINSPMAQEAYKIGVSYGLVNEETNSITPANENKLTSILSRPGVAQRFSRTRIGHWRQKLSDANQMLEKNPNDEKAQAAFERAMTGLNQAIGQDASLMEQMKNQPDEAGQFILGEGQTLFDGEGNEIASVEKTEDTPEIQSKIRQAQKDLDQLQGQKFRIASQADFMEAFQTNPAIAQWMSENGLSQPTKEARDLYSKYLEARIAETKGLLSQYGVTYQEKPQAAEAAPQASGDSEKIVTLKFSGGKGKFFNEDGTPIEDEN